jgi:exodeoxyribonuclease VII small subunit
VTRSEITETKPASGEIDAAADPAALSFEDAMRELDAIVEQMEDGTLSLEQSLAAYQRGAELVKSCQAKLESVRQQVQVLDGEILKPLGDLGDRPS